MLGCCSSGATGMLLKCSEPPSPRIKQDNLKKSFRYSVRCADVSRCCDTAGLWSSVLLLLLLYLFYAVLCTFSLRPSSATHTGFLCTVICCGCKLGTLFSIH